MTFKKAVKKMLKGCECYRPHWDKTKKLKIDSSGSILLEFCDGFTYWTPTVYDILADDWECEVYVSLPF